MSRFGSQYRISHHTGLCAATGRELEAGSTCVATLCGDPDGDGLVRQDFSLEAWEAGARPEALFSFWKTQVQVPGSRRKLLVDDEVLMDVFQRLEGEEQEGRQAFRFVLALILMRKRLLRFVGRKGGAAAPAATDAAGGRGEAAEVWLVRARGMASDEPSIEVINPDLSDDDVRELTGQLGEILQAEL